MSVHKSEEFEEVAIKEEMTEAQHFDTSPSSV